MLKRYKLFFFALFVSYIGLVLCYWGTSVGIRPGTLFLQMRRYIPCALAVAIAISLWKQSGFGLKQLLPHAVVGLLWVLVYPICYWLTFKNTLTFIDKHYDQAFGAYFFAFSVCLRFLVVKFSQGQDKKWIQHAFGLLHTVALLIPLLQLGYYSIYKYPITEAASMALLQTNPAEAKEFLLLNIGYGGLVAIALFLVGEFLVFSRLNSLNEANLESVNVLCFGKKSIVCAVVVLLATLGYGSKMFKDTGVMETYCFAKEYFERTNKFKKYHEKNFAQLEVTKPAVTFAKQSTIIMVIGESASAYYMSAYSDVKNDNTPWLKSMRNNASFILFPHAYTSWGQTVPSLERALTEKNQYNDKEFNDSLTLLDIAKKAGYNTYWFSNQGYISNADTPITLVAKTADYAKWLSEDKRMQGKQQYDGDLLEYLKEVDPKQNNFIVLHFMGSHEDCINRYPRDFAKFSQPGEFDMVKNYDDSLAYTDYILQQVHKYASENLNLQAMLYFSDHGGDPCRKRHPELSGFKSLQIPMFVYVSDEYQQLYGEAVQTYRNNKNKYFTNDMIYEVVCDLLRIKSNHFVEENSVLSGKYKFTRETLTTNLGKTKLTADKEPRKDE